MVSHTPVAARARRKVVAQWFCIFGPLLAAYTQQQLAYSWTKTACVKGVPLLMQVPSLIGLVILVAAALLSWKELNKANEVADASEARTVDPSRFVGVVGITLAGLAFVLMFAQWLPTLFFNPCQR